MSGNQQPKRVQVLGFQGCPNTGPTREMVERLVSTLAVEAQVEWVEVADESDARRLRFLGSPSVRVDDLDVELGSENRDDYVFSCRVYPSPNGLIGTPPESWVAQALTRTR